MNEAPFRRRLVTLPLYRRDSIGSAYHVLTFESREPIAVLPGHFAMVRSATWGEAPLLPRPMSLLGGGDRPSILIKVVGEGTFRMAHAAGGEPFRLLLPLGRPFEPCPEGHRPILVAGGVGVAPLLFLARALDEARRAAVRAGRPPQVKPPLTLYGGRTQADLPLAEELGETTELCVATEDGSRGIAGRVTVLLEQALGELVRTGQRAKVYTCGPHAMMTAVARLCRAQHVPCEVSLETPMACGYGVCLGCPVPRSAGGYLYACTEGPCIDASLIDWSSDRPGHASPANPPRPQPHELPR